MAADNTTQTTLNPLLIRLFSVTNLLCGTSMPITPTTNANILGLFDQALDLLEAKAKAPTTPPPATGGVTVEAFNALSAEVRGQIDQIGRRVSALEAAGAPTAPAPSYPPSVLPNFKGIDPQALLWQWLAKWWPANWGPEGKMAAGIPWKADQLKVLPTGELVITVDADGAGQFQAGNNEVHAGGLWEADVTFGPEVPGLVQAPLWLFNGDTAAEFDFELVGATGGLQIAVHGAQFDMSRDKNGVALPGIVLPAGQAGKRMILGIRYVPAVEAVFYIDRKEVGRRSASQFAPGVFPSSPVKAILDSWAAAPGLADWTGPWTGTHGKDLSTIIHGYQFTPL